MSMKGSQDITIASDVKRPCNKQEVSTMDCDAVPLIIIDEGTTINPDGFINLGEDLMFGANTYESQVKVHIRKFRACDDGTFAPTKVGITLNGTDWSSFKYYDDMASVVIGQRIMLSCNIVS